MTDITEQKPEGARGPGSILIIVAARMARREFFTPLHALCESGKRVVSTKALCDAVERAEEHMVSQVSKIVDGHDRLTKKLKEAESRNAELVEALEKAQAAATQQGNIACALLDEVTQLRRHADEKAPELRALLIEADSELEVLRQRIAELESRTVKLPKRSVGEVMHMSGFSRDYAEGWCSGNDNAIHEMRAAGIKVEGE